MNTDKKEVLDNGYVQLIETWGSDERIIEAARMSTAKGFLGWGPKCRQCGDAFAGDEERNCPNPAPGKPLIDCGRGGHIFDAPGDEKLLKFLWNNAHATPFEMAGLTIEVKAPIFVFREWHRHRVPFGYNEMSARYVPLPDENYAPTVERILAGANTATTNRQAQGTGRVVTELDAKEWLRRLDDAYKAIESVYQHGLTLGIPKELARLPVAVGRYSAMRATGNLRGWLAFLKLRCAPGAQYEIRMYANAVAEMVKEKFPRTYEVARESVGMA